MKMVVRLILLAVVVAGGVWLWTIISPSPEKLIRQRLDKVERDTSYTADESSLAVLGKAQKLAGFFNTNVEVNVDLPEHFEHVFASREELLQAVAGLHSEFSSLTVKFLDVTVTISPNKQSATADLTLQAQTADKGNFAAQEMKFTLQKIDGEWLITRIETVRTLS